MAAMVEKELQTKTAQNLESPPLPLPTAAPYGAAPICCALHREAIDTLGDVGKCPADLRHKYGARVDTSELVDEVWWSVSIYRHCGCGLVGVLDKWEPTPS
jgi:hypothetical protein